MKMRSHSALTAFALVFLQGIYCFHLQPSHNGLLRCFHRRRCTAIKASVVPGPPQETKPDYENIHGPLGADMDKLFMRVFRSKMVEQVGFDSSLPQDDYSGLMELAAALNARYSNREEVQKRAQAVLCRLLGSVTLCFFLFSHLMLMLLQTCQVPCFPAGCQDPTQSCSRNHFQKYVLFRGCCCCCCSTLFSGSHSAVR